MVIGVVNYGRPIAFAVHINSIKVVKQCMIYKRAKWTVRQESSYARTVAIKRVCLLSTYVHSYLNDITILII